MRAILQCTLGVFSQKQAKKDSESTSQKKGETDDTTTIKIRNRDRGLRINE